MYYLSDDEFFYMETEAITVGEKIVQSSTIFKVECLFGSFKYSKVYKDKEQKAEILNFSVDNTRRDLMILSGIKNSRFKRDKFVTIYDLDTETQLIRI